MKYNDIIKSSYTEQTEDIHAHYLRMNINLKIVPIIALTTVLILQIKTYVNSYISQFYSLCLFTEITN